MAGVTEAGSSTVAAILASERSARVERGAEVAAVLLWSWPQRAGTSLIWVPVGVA
jgi:hypothetical protein